MSTKKVLGGQRSMQGNRSDLQKPCKQGISGKETCSESIFGVL